MNYDTRLLRADIRAGITSAAVVLPLALAFGVVSGLGPIAGLWGAVAVGFLAAVVGGTRVQISAATAPVAIAVSFILVRYADSAVEALAIIFIAGIIQILLGLLRLGNLVQYTPYSVASGFISGVGIMVVLLQVLPFFGADPVLGNPLDSIREWPGAARDMDFHAFGLAGHHLRDLRGMAKAVAQLRASRRWRARVRDRSRRMDLRRGSPPHRSRRRSGFLGNGDASRRLLGCCRRSDDHRSHRHAEQPPKRLGSPTR